MQFLCHFHRQNKKKMEKEPITIEGLKKLQGRIRRFKKNKRPKVVAAIAEARAHGDLKENAEYHAAKRTTRTYRR